MKETENALARGTCKQDRKVFDFFVSFSNRHEEFRRKRRKSLAFVAIWPIFTPGVKNACEKGGGRYVSMRRLQMSGNKGGASKSCHWKSEESKSNESKTVKYKSDAYALGTISCAGDLEVTRHLMRRTHTAMNKILVSQKSHLTILYLLLLPNQDQSWSLFS